MLRPDELDGRQEILRCLFVISLCFIAETQAVISLVGTSVEAQDALELPDCLIDRVLLIVNTAKHVRRLLPFGMPLQKVDEGIDRTFGVAFEILAVSLDLEGRWVSRVNLQDTKRHIPGLL